MSDRYEYTDLANYNSEVARGIVHTPEWKARMAVEQERFNANKVARIKAEGGEEVSPGCWIIPPRPQPKRWWQFGTKQGLSA